MSTSSTPPVTNSKRAMRPALRVVPGRSRRGFAAMDPDKQLEIARKGGTASQLSGKGHQFTSDEARLAGQKGGRVSRRGPSKSRPQA
jgi:general stress protein YciG